MTQAELAARARTSAPTISAYEHGTKQPRADVLLRLLRAVDVEPVLVPAATANDRSVDSSCDALAEHLRRDPDLLEQARGQLDRMRPSLNVDAWRWLLGAGPNAVVAVLTSRDPDARGLKADNRFGRLGLVDEDIRLALVQDACAPRNVAIWPDGRPTPPAPRDPRAWQSSRPRRLRDVELPPITTMSEEADLAVVNDLSGDTPHQIEAQFGMGSPTTSTSGCTPTASASWRSLCRWAGKASKLIVAVTGGFGRRSDREFVGALIEAGLVEPELLTQRTEQLPDTFAPQVPDAARGIVQRLRRGPSPG